MTYHPGGRGNIQKQVSIFKQILHNVLYQGGMNESVCIFAIRAFDNSIKIELENISLDPDPSVSEILAGSGSDIGFSRKSIDIENKDLVLV